jgi:hypothetical protein
MTEEGPASETHVYNKKRQVRYRMYVLPKRYTTVTNVWTYTAFMVRTEVRGNKMFLRNVCNRLSDYAMYDSTGSLCIRENVAYIENISIPKPNCETLL